MVLVARWSATKPCIYRGGHTFFVVVSLLCKSRLSQSRPIVEAIVEQEPPLRVSLSVLFGYVPDIGTL